MRAVLLCAFLAALLPTARAVVGGDVAYSTSTSDFQCAVGDGWQFVIVRGYHNYGAPDTNAPTTLSNAASAGIQYRDIYHFPCAFGVSASDQISASIANVGLSNFGTLWLDIETNPDSNCAWQSDMSNNCNFLQSLVTAAQNQGATVGIYSSEYMWGKWMGDSCTFAAEAGVPLWYAHYDQTQSFSDFSSFGGWSTPAIKQYWDSVGICGISADADWYP